MEEDKIKKIRERAESRAGFFVHLIIYVLVNTLLVVLNFFTRTDGDGIWVIFPIVGWGIGLTAHFLGVFVFDNYVERYVQREVQKEMSKN